jgi:glycosyltransferase involved in cell wall biosynthesis
MKIGSRYAIVIPTYNHKKHLRRVVENTLQLGLPVFVVDDGSTDSTPEILSSISGLTILRHEKNVGKGAALLTGFGAAAQKADWAVTMDADGQHNPEEILSLIQAIPDGQRPLVIGTKGWRNKMFPTALKKILQLLGLGLREMSIPSDSESTPTPGDPGEALPI